MTLRSLKKMPHLQKVYGIMRRDFHLQFECQSEATPTRKNRLRPFGWVIKGGNKYKSQRSHPVPLMGLFVYPRLSCFAPFCGNSSFKPCTTPVHLFDISYICIVTRRSIQASTEYKYKTLFICKGKRPQIMAVFWTELSCKCLERLQSDGFHPSWKLPGWKHVWCPLSIFTFTITVSAVPAWHNTFKNCFVKHMKNK